MSRLKEHCDDPNCSWCETEIDLNAEAAEAQHAEHEAGDCPKDCPWCLDADAADPLLVQHRRVFERLFGGGR